jgi:hypothetical protein
VNFTDPTGLQCDGCEITVTGARPRSSGVLVGIGGAGRLQLDMPIESGEGGSGLAEDGQDITVTGRRLRTVKVFPNSNGVFECRFIGGNIVTIGFQNTSGTNGAYVNLSSYPAGPEGQQILQVVNPGSNPFHQSARSHVFWFSSIDIDMVARTPSSSGIYHHLLFGRRNEAPVASGQPYFNITVRTNGGWGTCGAF